MTAKFIVVTGPTASGKSAAAISLAQKIGAVIVNYDSKQLYKDLGVISARPTPHEENIVPHKLFGVLEAKQVCSAGSWLEMAKNEISAANNKPLIFVGGTGMYLSALTNGIAQIPEVPEEIISKVRSMAATEVAAQLGADADINPRRNTRALEVLLATGKPIKFWHENQPSHDYKPDDFLILFMNVSRETLYERINMRLKKMMDEGALGEGERLLKMELDKDLPIMRSIGVPELAAYIKGDITYDEAVEKVSQSTRNYAKRQLTWMRNQVDNKIEIQNLNVDEIYKLVQNNLKL